MASQTKVDSAGRTARERAAERRAAEKRAAEAAPVSYAPDASASGTFSARATEEERGAADSDFAPARSSVEDEDVSLDELMMSDSAEEEDEEEEEATDIHPGLSDALLAESLRGVRVPSPVAAMPAASVPEASVPAASVPEASVPEASVRQASVPQASVREATALEEEVEDAVEMLAEDDSSPGSSYPELQSSAVRLEAEAEASRAAAEAAQAAAAGDDESGARAEEESSLELELQREVEQEALSAGSPEAASEPSAEAGPRATSSEDDAQQAASAPQRGEEPTQPDAAPAELIELEPESVGEILTSASGETVAFGAQAALEADEPSVPTDIDLVDELEAELETVQPSAAAAERQTVPDTLAAKRRDAPLPSFDIPDLEANSMAAAGAGAAGAGAEPRSRINARAVALPPLSEIAEDDEDDDAVTHMGLPAVPEAANDAPAPGGFQVADAAVAALESLDADIRRGDPRRATTRVIPRVDLKSLPAKPRVHAPAGPPLAERVGGLLREGWARVSSFRQSLSGEGLPDGQLSPARERFNWMVENVLPPLSLVLFGSGLGAGVIMLVETGRSPEAAAQTQTVQALQEASPRGPLTLTDRARAGDGEALYKITNMPQGERTSSLTLALEAGYQAQKLREFREFSKSLIGASGTLPAASVTRMVDYATSPETMLPAFQELTQWTGSAGPDVLYAVWEKAAGGSRAASLAQQLLYSADQRAKATPALVVALDLRSAANCDDYLHVLPAVQRNGDQRSSATLRALRHKDGCGADGQQDCYACLRDNSLLEDALKAVEGR
jgi:hypothetical protein